MHPNPIFRKETEERNIAFIRERAFGTLAINASEGPLLSHVPFTLLQNNKIIELHLVRSNPILHAIEEPTDAVISVLGGDSYITPDWYFIDDQVPTWNYIAVHLHGKISRLPQEEIHGVLDRLTASMENRLLPKAPWTSQKMDQTIYEKMLRQIVPVRMEVTEINGTWKLSQNKSDEVRLAAAKGVAENGIGHELEFLSNIMRKSGD